MDANYFCPSPTSSLMIFSSGEYQSLKSLDNPSKTKQEQNLCDAILFDLIPPPNYLSELLKSTQTIPEPQYIPLGHILMVKMVWLSFLSFSLPRPLSRGSANEQHQNKDTLETVAAPNDKNDSPIPEIWLGNIISEVLPLFFPLCLSSPNKWNYLKRAKWRGPLLWHFR